jgi:pimeloyl-ACP methyl ester carboxylesterase
MKSSNAATARTFVLVHGASRGGWCYGRVAETLRSHGHRVFTPTLSGLAERSRDNCRHINLTTHINEILDLFKWEELDDIVLCGHSYGGMVVGGVADKIPKQIRNLVFLDAVIPENGKCMIDHVFPGEAFLPFMDAVGTFGGGFMLPPRPAAFFSVNEADQTMVDRLCTPHPIASLLEKITIGSNADSIANHTYIYGTKWGFPPITQQYERAKTLPGWKVFEVEAGHDIMIDAPVQLAEILDSLD